MRLGQTVPPTMADKEPSPGTLRKEQMREPLDYIRSWNKGIENNCFGEDSLFSSSLCLET
jgi:hypothetical protein